MRPEALARRAAWSIRAGRERNGIAYLRRVCASGIRTPLTAPYAEAVMALAGRAGSLEEAERRLVALAADPGEGSAVGLG
jgi:hypothetical protein